MANISRSPWLWTGKLIWINNFEEEKKSYILILYTHRKMEKLCIWGDIIHFNIVPNGLYLRRVRTFKHYTQWKSYLKQFLPLDRGFPDWREFLFMKEADTTNGILYQRGNVIHDFWHLEKGDKGHTLSKYFLLTYWPSVLIHYHTSWVAVVTPTDRPKSVRNRYVIELFYGVVCVVTLPFWHLCWCKGFYHRTEADLFLFLIVFI